MREKIRRLVAAWSCAVLLALFSLPPAAAAPSPVGSIEGILTAPDGRPAAGWGIVLLTPEGELVARDTVSSRGGYRFARVPAGSYALAAQDHEGRFAPVVGAPAKVTAGTRARRDFHLVPAEGQNALSQTTFGPRGESWWSRQTRNQKIWTLVAIGVGAGLVLAVVNDLTDDDETPASGYR